MRVVSSWFRFRRQSGRWRSAGTTISTEHPDDEKPANPVDSAKCHEKHSHSFGASVHGIALAAGNEAAATCVDCHGTHDVFPQGSEHSLTHFSKLAESCGSCHAQEAEDLAASVHGTALASGERDAATCTDCHSEHRIRSLSGGDSPIMTAAACSTCHGSERINSRLRLPSDRVSTFFASYHGLASEGGSTTAANCASCHGYHLILPSANPESMIHPSQLTTTCGRCHPGAGENFNVRHLVRGGPKARFGRFGRFGYPEKFEYWAVVWGTVIMGLTGLAIWCKIDVTRWLPRWAVEVAIAAGVRAGVAGPGGRGVCAVGRSAGVLFAIPSGGVHGGVPAAEELGGLGVFRVLRAAGGVRLRAGFFHG